MSVIKGVTLVCESKPVENRSQHTIVITMPAIAFLRSLNCLKEIDIFFAFAKACYKS